MLRKILTALLSVAIAAGVVTALPPAATAAGGPTYPVMNTSEYPPDGIYFRNGPDWNNTSRVTGWGVYAGDRVQLWCWQTGADNVLRRSGGNNVWYIALNVTRPSRSGGENSGWINAHFVNDGTQPYQVAPGVPACVNGQVPQTPQPNPGTPPVPQLRDGGSVYYSPYDSDTIKYRLLGLMSVTVPSLATVTMYRQAWDSPATCNGSLVGNFPDVVGNRRITTLSGWSIGRQGPLYFLRDYPNRRANIHYVVLFDPGSYDELTSDCTRSTASQIYQNWLLSDSHNRLVIFSGATTRDVGHPSRVNGRTYYDRGIQEVYFTKIRGTATASRVTVCEYNNMSHPDVWINFRAWQNYAPITSSCPTAADGTNANAVWHP